MLYLLLYDHRQADGDRKEGTLDFSALVAPGERMRAVAHVQLLEGCCEESGLVAVERAVAEHDLNRVVVAFLSPRLYADRFDEPMARLDLSTRLLARANIREGAAWVRDKRGNPATATTVARGEVEMAVAGLREAPYRFFRPLWQEGATQRVLILGGGLAGMTAALTLADSGVACDLVEREAHLGANLREIRRTLEGLDRQALLAEMVEQVQRSERVCVWTEAELMDSLRDVQGDFTAEVRSSGKVRSEQYGALIVATGAYPATTRFIACASGSTCRHSGWDFA